MDNNDQNTPNDTDTSRIQHKKKRRNRRSRLWLHKPKRPPVQVLSTPAQQLPQISTKAPQKRQQTAGSNIAKKRTKLSFPDTVLDVIETETMEEDYFVEPNENICPELNEKEDSDVISKLMTDIMSHMPQILQRMKDAKSLSEFHMLMKVIADGSLPSDNIAFRLLLETARWFSCSTTTQMWYWPDTMTFWKAGFRIMKEKFILFMSGLKNTGQVVDGSSSRGNYDPKDSQVNFAVPSMSALRTFREDMFPQQLSPGVIESALDLKSTLTDCDFVISVDGKKLAPGVNKDDGDIDLFGNEVGPTFKQLKEKMREEKRSIEDAISKVSDNAEGDLTLIPDESKKSLHEEIKRSVTVQGKYIQQIRILQTKQEYAMDKLIKQGGEDLQKNRFIFAISSIKAVVHQIKDFIQDTCKSISQLCHCGSLMMNANTYVPEPVVNQSCQPNWLSLKHPDLIPEVFAEDSNYILQKTDKWFDLRSKFKITGSTIHNALGFRTLKEQQIHYDKTVLGKEQSFSPEVQERMNYGTANEANAVATLTAVVLPLLFPDMCYVEEGSYIVNSSDNQPLILVSPDGSLRPCVDNILHAADTLPEYGIEIKCPPPSATHIKTPVYYDLPEWYVCQVLAEMAALKVQKLLFVCYTPQTSTVFMVSFDQTLWDVLINEAERLYDGPKPRRPTKLSNFAKESKFKLKQFVEKNVVFLGEFPSRIREGSEVVQLCTDEGSPYLSAGLQRLPDKQPNMSDLRDSFNHSLNNIGTAFNLLRRKAVEVLVWLLQSTDRVYNPEAPHSIPIAYALKGYSLSSDIMRSMCDNIMIECHKRNIRVVCMAFDGQWSAIVNRDGDGMPLTLLQLQKYVWEQSKKVPKAVQVRRLMDINTENELEEGGSPVVFTFDHEHDGHRVLNVSSKSKSMQRILEHINWSRLQKLIRKPKVSRKNTQNQSQHPEIMSGDAGWLPQEVLEEFAISDDHDDNDAIMGQMCEIDESVTNNLEMDFDAEEEIHDTTVENCVTVTANLPLAASPDETCNEMSQMCEINESVTNNSEIDLVVYEAHNQETVNITATLPLAVLTDVTCKEIIDDLKSKNTKKWKDKGVFEIRNAFSSADSLMKFTLAELDVIIKDTQYEQAAANIVCKKSWRKVRIANALSKLFGDGSEVSEVSQMKGKKAKKMKLLQPNRLTQIASKAVKKLPKVITNAAYACLTYDDIRTKWEATRSIEADVSLGQLDSNLTWFSFPEKHKETGLVFAKLLDGDHLFVNTRVKVCRDGLEGVSKKAWLAVAEYDSSVISKSLVEDLIDKQKNAYACRTFSSEVEGVQRKLGFSKEAHFTSLLRRWYEAEDARAIPANERAKRRLDLREWLLDGVDLQSFPPYGGHIKGIPQVTFEGYLQSIDTHLQLYGLCRSGTYNQRSVGTLENETFFGILGEVGSTKLGCPKAVDINRTMAVVSEVMHIRQNPDCRTFQMRTSKKAVYPAHGMEHDVQGDSDENADRSTYEAGHTISRKDLVLKDHFFDSADRARVKEQRKPGDISDLNAPAHGVQPVRQHHRVDEQKLLPTKRLRIE